MKPSSQRFERCDLRRRTFNYACGIAKLCHALEKDGIVPKRAVWQLFDAGTSVAANHTESRAASSRRDLLAKERIVLREAREALFWLRLIANVFDKRRQIVEMLAESLELVLIFTASVKRLRGSLLAESQNPHPLRYSRPAKSAMRTFDFKITDWRTEVHASNDSTSEFHSS